MRITKQKLLDMVKRYVADQHPDGMTLSVVEAGVHRDKNWWYVPVQPDHEPEKLFQYYEALADLEGKMQDDENLTVLFIPVQADKATAA